MRDDICRGTKAGSDLTALRSGSAQLGTEHTGKVALDARAIVGANGKVPVRRDQAFDGTGGNTLLLTCMTLPSAFASVP